MYGWRARIGVLIPSGITVMEGDLNLLTPEGVSCHYHRYGFTGGKPGDEKDVMEGLTKAEAYVEAATEIIVHARPSVIVFGGTGTSFIGGYGYDQKLIDLIERKSNGIPATTTSTSVIKALNALGARKISLAAPYVEGASRAAVNFIEAHDIEVVDAQWLGRSGPDIPETNQETAYRLAKAVDKPDSEAVFISCTDFNVLPLIRSLEVDLAKPVITSNQATVWDMLRMAGINDRIAGYGRLLEDY